MTFTHFSHLAHLLAMMRGTSLMNWRRTMIASVYFYNGSRPAIGNIASGNAIRCESVSRSKSEKKNS
jgi:hypothetical protein